MRKRRKHDGAYLPYSKLKVEKDTYPASGQVETFPINRLAFRADDFNFATNRPAWRRTLVDSMFFKAIRHVNKI